MRPFTRLVVLLVLVGTFGLVISACNGDGEEEEPTALPDAQSLLEQAIGEIESSDSFLLEIDVSGLPVRIQVGDIALPEELPLTFEYARGTFVKPDRLQAMIDIRVGDAVARTELIAMGADQYMRSDLITQGNWVKEQVISGFSPEDLLAPETGIPTALGLVRDLEMVERTDLDGLGVYHLAGTIDAQDVYALTFGLIGTKTGALDLDVYLRTDSNRLERLVISEPLPDDAEEGDEATQWTINMLEYNEDYTIEAPAIETEEAPVATEEQGAQ